MVRTTDKRGVIPMILLIILIAAVQAVVFAEVAQFHQPAQEDGVSEMLDAQIIGV